jgi:hypothetical protein
LVSLFLIEIEDEYRDLLVRHRFRTKVPINQLQAAVWQLAGQESIGVSDLAQQSAQRLSLGLGMPPPILGVGY